MTPSPKAGVNVDLTIAMHSSESLPTGLNERTMGFMLATDSKGAPMYSVKDLAPAEVVARVEAAGYPINPQTLEMVFYKSAWDGPFGAYEEVPGNNRPGIGVDVDFKGSKPICGPKQYSIVGKIRTASMSFATTTPGTITDAANGLAEFKTGDTLVVTGTASNNGTYTISTGGVAGTIRTTEATTAEGAVSTTLTLSVTAAFTDIKLFGSNFYVCGGRFVYIVASWGSSPYLYQVFRHSSAVTFNQLHLHNGYMYTNAGTTGTYAYTADGTTWVESTRGGTDAQATEMANLRGILHKRVGQNHYQMSAATDNGINGGTAWSSADQVNDTSATLQRMFVGMDSLVFSTLTGMVSLDANGNFNEMLPELQDMGPVGQSSARVWNNNSIIYPMSTGAVSLYSQESNRLVINPMQQVDRILPITQMTQPPLNTKLTMTGTVDERLYALQSDGTNERVITLEQKREGYGWRSFLGTFSGSNAADKMWTLYKDSDGPVLFLNTSSAGTLYYYILPLGSDATADSRSKFASSTVIYDPWITYGIPEINKRWSYVRVAVTQSTPANFAKTTYVLDAVNEAGSDVMTDTLTMAQGITIDTLDFTANTISRRARLTHTLGNTGASQENETPILLWEEVHAYALPTPKRQFTMALDVPTATVGHGVATQDQARRFLDAIRGAQLPMTLTDRFGSSWTVNRAVEEPTETYASLSGRRTEEVYGLRLIQQPTGV